MKLANSSPVATLTDLVKSPEKEQIMHYKFTFHVLFMILRMIHALYEVVLSSNPFIIIKKKNLIRTQMAYTL